MGRVVIRKERDAPHLAASARRKISTPPLAATVAGPRAERESRADDESRPVTKDPPSHRSRALVAMDSRGAALLLSSCLVRAATTTTLTDPESDRRELRSFSSESEAAGVTSEKNLYPLSPYRESPRRSR